MQNRVHEVLGILKTLYPVELTDVKQSAIGRQPKLLRCFFFSLILFFLSCYVELSHIVVVGFRDAFEF